MAEALAMENSPDIMSQYLHKLGVSARWRLVDVVALEGEALTWVPRPVLAVILLFPLSDVYEEHRASEATELANKQDKKHDDIFHMKQERNNVCGTVALVHSVANNKQHIDIEDGGILQKYLNAAQGLNAVEKGQLLENSQAIFDAYKELVKAQGDDEEEEGTVTNHFVTFIHKEGNLYELDGRKDVPVVHGPTTEETFLEDAAAVCRRFIEREPDNIGFTVVALVPNE